MIRNYVRETKERVTTWLVVILLGMIFVAFLQAHGVTFNLFVSF